MAAYSSLERRGVSCWGCCSCCLPINVLKSIPHYLPFCFFFFLLRLGAACSRWGCLARSFFFWACSCRISCSCFLTEGFCSGAGSLPVGPGEELLSGEEFSDGLFAASPCTGSFSRPGVKFAPSS